jgi:hypothetical protein
VKNKVTEGAKYVGNKAVEGAKYVGTKIAENPQIVGGIADTAANLAMQFGGPYGTAIGGALKGGMKALSFLNKDNPDSWFSKAAGYSEGKPYEPEIKKEQSSSILNSAPKGDAANVFSNWKSPQGLNGSANPSHKSFSLFEQ